MNVQKLLDDNYTILNGKIINVVTDLKDKDTFNFSILIQGDGWQCLYGNFNLFNPEFDSKSSIVDLLGILEKTNILDLTDTYVRIAFKDTNTPIEFIGNIIFDSWYNFNDYYEESGGIIFEEEPVEYHTEVEEPIEEEETNVSGEEKE